MATKCSSCRRLVHPVSRQPLHLFHLVVTLITCGFWAPVWLGDALACAMVRTCPACGSAL